MQQAGRCLNRAQYAGACATHHLHGTAHDALAKPTREPQVRTLVRDHCVRRPSAAVVTRNSPWLGLLCQCRCHTGPQCLLAGPAVTKGTACKAHTPVSDFMILQNAMPFSTRPEDHEEDTYTCTSTEMMGLRKSAAGLWPSEAAAACVCFSQHLTAWPFLLCHKQ